MRGGDGKSIFISKKLNVLFYFFRRRDVGILLLQYINQQSPWRLEILPCGDGMLNTIYIRQMLVKRFQRWRLGQII